MSNINQLNIKEGQETKCEGYSIYQNLTYHAAKSNQLLLKGTLTRFDSKYTRANRLRFFFFSSQFLNFIQFASLWKMSHKIWAFH